MGAKQIDTRVSRGLAWIGMASSVVGVLDFLSILLILGIWIPAEQYGIATKAVWIFPILDYATDLGLSAAVVQRDDHDSDTISTVFWINLATALVIFGVLVVFAPIAATHFYHHEIVGWLIIAYGSKLIWQNVYFIPAALMRKELRFKELSMIRVLANLAEFAGKVGFAAGGAGIWCFVLGPLCRVLVTGIGCQICHPWRPRFVLKLRKAWSYATFGAKSAGSQVLFFLYTNIDYPIVGYFFGDKALGVYRLAYEIVLEPARVISHVVTDIAFPTFAKLRHQKDALTARFLSFTRLNLVTVLLYATVVFVLADDLIAVLFPTYVGAADAVRILCGVAVLRSVSFVIPPLLDGIGFPGRTFLYTLTAAIVLPTSFIVAANVAGDELGFYAVAWAWALGYPLAFAVLVYMALVAINLSAGRFVARTIGVPACAIASGLVGAGVHAILPDAVPLAVRMVASAVVIVGVMATLLAYTQGLSIAAARRALEGQPEAEDEPAPASTPLE